MFFESRVAFYNYLRPLVCLFICDDPEYRHADPQIKQVLRTGQRSEKGISVNMMDDVHIGETCITACIYEWSRAVCRLRS